MSPHGIILKIAISGTSGFVGKHVCSFLSELGHETIALVRDPHRRGIYWNPEAGEIDASSLNGIDAVIHLAGENVAERWTAEKKQRIYDSRVGGTRLLVNTLVALQSRPVAFLCASAIGYYGERGAEVLTEDSEPGTTFLSRVCIHTAAASRLLEQAGVRVANLRFGIILSTTGGAFPRMLAPFEMGAGGKLGTGRQFMSWIALTDALSAVNFLLNSPHLAGPVNVVAPQPVTNEYFTETLAGILDKPALIPVPATMAYLAYGREMADQVLLASARVLPEKLSAAGFQFKYPQLETALRHILSERL